MEINAKIIHDPKENTREQAINQSPPRNHLIENYRSDDVQPWTAVKNKGKDNGRNNESGKSLMSTPSQVKCGNNFGILGGGSSCVFLEDVP